MWGSNQIEAIVGQKTEKGTQILPITSITRFIPSIESYSVIEQKFKEWNLILNLIKTLEQLNNPSIWKSQFTSHWIDREVKKKNGELGIQINISTKLPDQ